MRDEKEGRKKQARSNIHVHVHQHSLCTQSTVCSITPLRDVVSYTHGEGDEGEEGGGGVGKGHVHALGVLCCFALFVCLTLLASFFLPSHLSFKNMYIYSIQVGGRVCNPLHHDYGMILLIHIAM